LEETNINTIPPKRPKLGGWLIPISVLLNIIWMKLVFGINDFVKLLSDPLLQEARFMVLFNIVLSAISIVYIIYLLVLMYMKKRLFVKSVNAFIIFVILINILSYFLFKSYSPEMSEYLLMRMITAVITGVLLIAYFTKSKRVKATFIL
jgi:hypothetical protein